ncbi:hypothetical protein CPB84DRAFT_1847331 [Gymnopilus junonius]|uniref:Dienelactone hydrolase domain-containing protein n=1 Tax=Gymnopilus junonius TaxID=109634 RepID=A0A9P5NQ99_GYMJU|nr:hypothetical protein CPB84DRAFT_1847331 [Gymnopilus junonius]
MRVAYGFNHNIESSMMYLLADAFAENGFKTIIPDLLNGGPVPPSGLAYAPDFDLGKWFTNHSQEQTRPPLDKVINALKEQGVTTFGATGYCFSTARYVFDLTFENTNKASVVAHSSLLKVPDDLEFSIDSQAKADEIFGNGKFTPGYKRNLYERCTHGFAVRGDMTGPKIKAGKEGAFKETVEWFI